MLDDGEQQLDLCQDCYVGVLVRAIQRTRDQLHRLKEKLKEEQGRKL